MAAWAEEFDAPIYIHAKDRQWVTEPCSKIEYWQGESLPPLCICLSTSKDSQEALACYLRATDACPSVNHAMHMLA